MKKIFEEKRKRWTGRLLFAAVLAAISVIGTGRLTVSAAGMIFDDGDFTYEVNDGGVTVSLIVYNGNGGVVQIPETANSVNKYPVVSIGNQAFLGMNNITSVNIPNGVTSIGEDAFKNCSSLTSVTIPNSVTNIEGDAFLGCRSDLILWHNGNASVISYAADNNLTAYQTDYVVDITQQPASQEVTEGDKASFTVAATAKSGGAISYQWEVSKDGSSRWDKIEGATSAKYELTDVKTEWSGWQYRCAVTESGYGIGYSAAAALTVTAKETGSGTAVPGTGTENSSGTAVPVTGTGNSSDAGVSGTKSGNGDTRYGKNVQTGVEEDTAIWAGLLAVSALLGTLSVIAGRKRKA